LLGKNGVAAKVGGWNWNKSNDWAV